MKKLLALVLALVMTLSLATLSTNATVFADADKVTYEDAVACLNVVGVLQGDQNGNVNPTDTIHRDAAAKIIAYLALGQKAADAMSKDVTAFTDVAAGNWACGYITYCYNAGYISGDGAGHFYPNNNVTALEFANMLAAVLGYDKKAEGLTGSEWKLAAAKLATKLGLFDGNEDVAVNDPATREEAALYAFNALNDETVYYTAGAVSVKGDGFEVSVGGSGAIGTGKTLSATLYGNKLTSEEAEDAMGVPGTTWAYGDNEVFAASYEKVASFDGTAALTLGKIAKALGMTAGKKAAFTVIVDGQKAAATDLSDVTTASNVAVSGLGALVDVYKTDTAEYVVVVANTYIQKLASGNIIAAKPETATKEAVEAAVKIGSYTIETEEFAADDVVIYTVAKDDAVITSMELADSISGKVAGTSKTTVTIGGVAYALSAMNSAVIKTTPGYAKAAAEDAEYTYYLDKAGNILYAVEGEAEEVEKNYCFVLAAASKTANIDSTAGLFEESNASVAGAAQARILDVDTGAVSVVNVATKVKNGAVYYAKANGGVSTTELTDTDGKLARIGKYYEYTVLDDGSYVFGNGADVVGGTGDIATKKVTIGKAGQKFANVDGTNYIADAKTYYNTLAVYLDGYCVDNGDSAWERTPLKVVKTNYAGYSKLPAITTAKDMLVVTDSKGNNVTKMFWVDNNTYQAQRSDATWAFFVGEGEYDEDRGQGYVFANGDKLQTVYLDGAYATSAQDLANKSGSYVAGGEAVITKLINAANKETYKKGDTPETLFEKDTGIGAFCSMFATEKWDTDMLWNGVTVSGAFYYGEVISYDEATKELVFQRVYTDGSAGGKVQTMWAATDNTPRINDATNDFASAVPQPGDFVKIHYKNMNGKVATPTYDSYGHAFTGTEKEYEAVWYGILIVEDPR